MEGNRLKSAPDGAIWVCQCCGRFGKDATKLRGDMCFLKAVLCREESLVIGPRGLAVAAQRWEEDGLEDDGIEG